jgi:hypothetical protein
LVRTKKLRNAKIRVLENVAGIRQRPVAVAGFQPDHWPELGPPVAGFRRRQDSGDRQLLNSDDRISNMRVRTKSLISENDLRF